MWTQKQSPDAWRFIQNAWSLTGPGGSSSLCKGFQSDSTQSLSHSQNYSAFHENAGTSLASTLVHIQENSPGWLFLGSLGCRRGRSLEVPSPQLSLTCTPARVSSLTRARLQPSQTGTPQRCRVSLAGFREQDRRISPLLVSEAPHERKKKKRWQAPFVVLLSHSGVGSRVKGGEWDHKSGHIIHCPNETFWRMKGVLLIVIPG